MGDNDFMIIDASEDFLYKSAMSGNIEVAIKLYNVLQVDEDKYDEAAHFYQNILIAYNPKNAVEILANQEAHELFTREYFEAEYLFAVSVIARNLGSNDDGFLAVHWAKKGLDLFRMFNVEFDSSLKDWVNEVHQKLEWIFKKYQHHFDLGYYKNEAVFPWEDDYFQNRDKYYE